MFTLANPWFVCYEGDDTGAGDTGAGAGDTGAGDTGAGDPNAGVGGDEKLFTQTDVNTFIAKEKRQNQVRQREMAAELTQLKQNTALSQEEKGKLQERIEELQNQYMTVEERSKQAAAEAEKKSAGLVDTLTSERNIWQQRHSQLVIENSITHAATANEALFSEQIAAILTPNTKLVEKLDGAGQPSGNYEARVSFADKDSDGKSITLDLPVGDAVKRMRELPQYGNLFKGNKTGGLGQSGSAGPQKKTDMAKLAKENPAEYRRLRKEHRKSGS